MNLENVKTPDLIAELISRGAADTDNEGQYLVYTGVYQDVTIPS